MVEGKTCSTCFNFKSYVLYRKAKNIKDGYNTKCKDCERPIKQLHYQKNKKIYKEAFQEFMLENPDYYKNYKYKRNGNK